MAIGTRIRDDLARALTVQSLKIGRTHTAAQALVGEAQRRQTRAVNLTLNDGLVLQAKSYTANLSATVEALLTDYVAAQQLAKATRQQQASGWCVDWNAVHSSVGSFADEHSTL